MSELDGPGLAAVIAAVSAALVAVLTIVGKAISYAIDLLLRESRATIRAKNAEIAQWRKQWEDCERYRAQRSVKDHST